jgi:uncharacterized protein YkwD
MLAYSHAARARAVAGLAALLIPVAPASGEALHRARHRSGGNTACLNTTTRAASAPRRAIRAAVLCLVNQERAAHGLPRLRASSALTRSAQSWSDEMVAHETFSHGSDATARIARAGYHWATAGENIASGFATARAVMRAWMSDTGHCQNILNPKFRDIGIGINGHSMVGGPRGAATWTQDFGLRLSEAPRSSNWGPAIGCPYG